MDAMTVLGWIVAAVLAVFLVRREREARRSRDAMTAATRGLDAARRDLVAAREILRNVKAGRQ